MGDRIGTSTLWLAVALISGTTQAVEPAKIKAGNFYIVPILSFEERYDDNIFSQSSDETDSWISVVSPGVKLLSELSSVDLLLDYRHDAGFYANSSSDDYNDNYLKGAVTWELNQSHQFDLMALYRDAHEDRGTGYSQGDAIALIDEPDTYEDMTFEGKYTFGSDSSRGRLVLDVSDYSRQYTNHEDLTRVRDRDELRAGAAFYWRMAGKTNLVAEVQGADINYIHDPEEVLGQFDTLDSSTLRYLLGVNWEATGKTEGTVKLGLAEKDFDDDDREDFSGFSWEANVSWKPRTYSVFSLTTSSKPRETNGSGSYIDSELYSLDWTHSWTSRFSTQLFYSQTDSRYEDSPIKRDDQEDSYGLRLDYNLRRWLDLGLSFKTTDKESTLAQYSYDRNQVSFFIDLSL
ncbi:outer membrane beta-barrel protein [Pseudomaricurvus sp.]|uniref:outer membrane beta-barrel protein n=1 Tax=Pseudomaricurvus sp. TaxID=2004510 RepID=UPI003F6D7020